MIVERRVFPRAAEERNADSIPEPKELADADTFEETWEWDGAQWIKVS